MASFNHTQGSSSVTWTITHNLNSATIAIDVFIDNSGSLEKIMPANVVHTSNNTATVTFSSAQTGRARVIGL